MANVTAGAHPSYLTASEPSLSFQKLGHLSTDVLVVVQLSQEATGILKWVRWHCDFFDSVSAGLFY